MAHTLHAKPSAGQAVAFHLVQDVQTPHVDVSHSTAPRVEGSRLERPVIAIIVRLQSLVKSPKRPRVSAAFCSRSCSTECPSVMVTVFSTGIGQARTAARENRDVDVPDSVSWADT